MNPRRSATLAVAFYPTVVLAGWAFVSFTSTASPRIEKSATAAQVVDRLAPSLTAAINHAAAPQVAATAAPQTLAAQVVEVSAAIPATADVAAAAGPRRQSTR